MYCIAEVYKNNAFQRRALVLVLVGVGLCWFVLVCVGVCVGVESGIVERSINSLKMFACRGDNN